MPLAGGRVQLPIACTLDAVAGEERAARWTAILDSHRIDRHVTGGAVLMRFPNDPDAIRELTDLVEAERHCCGFLDWQLENGTAESLLRITGDPEQLAAITL